MDRNFVEMDAPINSGRTKEIAALVAYHTELEEALKRVMIITYCQALAQ